MRTLKNSLLLVVTIEIHGIKISNIEIYNSLIIQQRIKDYDIKTYIEPFCGGCNIIDKIQCDTKIASDNHKYLIEMFKNLNQIQILPEFITKNTIQM